MLYSWNKDTAVTNHIFLSPTQSCRRRRNWCWARSLVGPKRYVQRYIRTTMAGKSSDLGASPLVWTCSCIYFDSYLADGWKTRFYISRGLCPQSCNACIWKSTSKWYHQKRRRKSTDLPFLPNRCAPWKIHNTSRFRSVDMAGRFDHSSISCTFCG